MDYEALAKKYNAELEGANSAIKLSAELSNTADAMAKLRLVTQADYTRQMYSYTNAYNPGQMASISNVIPSMTNSSTTGTATVIDNSQIIVNNAGSIISKDEMLTTVQEALQRLNKQGSPTGVSGGLN